MTENYFERINRVVELLNDQVESSHSLQGLADAAQISPFHFNRVYRAATGETPFGTLRRLRIARALVLLRDTGKPVTEIAFDVGYESSQAFSKGFRRLTGHNATTIRQDRQQLNALIDDLSGVPGSVEEAGIEIRLVSVEPFKVIAARHVGPPEGLFTVFGGLFNHYQETGHLDDFRGIYGIPIDDPRDLSGDGPRFDACFDFGPDVRAVGNYTEENLGGGLYAVARHTGTYDGIDDKYDAIYGPWLRSGEYTLRNDRAYNHYLVDPESAPPEEWQTDIYIPVG